MINKLLTVIGVAVMTLPGLASNAQEPKKWTAARSVHLKYEAPESTVFYNEVTVDKSVPGSYFSVCGFSHGYFGIQELVPPRKKVVIFSVWEPGKQDNPNVVPDDLRVKMLDKGDGVRVARFGGEGTGGQSFYDYDWQVGETMRLMLKCVVNGKRTAYTAYFYHNKEKRWQKMATFETLANGDSIKGYYSFVEDFRRDTKSYGEVRSARYGNGWVKSLTGEWSPISKATFTADRTVLSDNIDMGNLGERFFLTTGGDTKNRLPLNGTTTVKPGKNAPDLEVE